MPDTFDTSKQLDRALHRERIMLIQAGMKGTPEWDDHMKRCRRTILRRKGED